MASGGETEGTGPRPGSPELGYALGLVVFAAGIALMLLAFFWGYQLFRGVDEQLARVPKTAAAKPTPATEKSVERGRPTSEKPAQVVEAKPQPAGPSLVEVLIGIAVKLAVLMVLAWIGGLTAGRGAQLAGWGRH